MNYKTHKSKIKFILFCFCVFCYFPNAFSQYKPFSKNPYNLQSKIDKVIQYSKSNQIEEYIIAINSLDSIEKLLIKKKENKLLSEFYFNTAVIFFSNMDLDATYANLQKGIVITKKEKNYRQLGLYYEGLAVYYKYLNDKKNKEKYYYLSEYYLTKYAPLEEQIDFNYNYTKDYVELGNWDKAIKYGERCVLIHKNTKIDIPSYLNVMLAEAYFNKDEIKKAEYYIDNAKKSSDFSDTYYKLNSYYYKIRGDIYLHNGKIEASKTAYDKSYEATRKLILSNIQTINKSVTLRNDFKQKVFQFEKEQKEADLIKKNNSYKNSIIFLSTCIIIILIVLILMQLRISKYKTRVYNKISLKNEELKEALSIRNKFIDIVAHELRTPLNAIQSVSLLLKDKYENEEHENFNILNNSLDYLNNLTSQVLQYFNLSEKNIVVRNEEINLKSSVNKVIDSNKLIYNKKNVITLNFDNTISDKLFFDKEKLLMVLNGFINNAFKFTKKGVINVNVQLIETNNDKEIIQFVIEDSGIGISNENLHLIFDLFYQGSHEISIKYGGTGLGLTIAKKILDLYECEIKVESNLGTGTKITFKLEFDKYYKWKTGKENVTVLLNDRSKDFKILLVEDNKVNQILTKKILNNSGFTCDIVENGLEAVNKVRNNEYSLILMDIMMPVMDGYEASKIISELKPHIPIVALTAVSEELNKDKFENANIKKVLNKPINIELFSETILLYCS